jgi:hypothetical protein
VARWNSDMLFGMADFPRYSLRNILIAATWVAVWFAAFANRSSLGGSLSSDLATMCIAYFLAIVPLPAAVGAIANRPLLGFVCGIAAMAGVGAWVFAEVWI